MTEPTPFQQNAAKTYICGDYGNLKKWHAAKDPYTIFIETGDDIFAVKYMIDDHIKVIPWVDMSPSMKDEAQAVTSPQPVLASTTIENQANAKAKNHHEENHPVYDPCPSWEEWERINRTKKGLLPGFLNGCGILAFLLGLWLSFKSENALLILAGPIVGAIVWFILGSISSMIRSLRTIETYTANIYEQTRALNGKE